MSIYGVTYKVGNDMVAPRLAAVIPAFNEARCIQAVVQQVSQCALAIVVDDGSTDDTAALARDAGAHVVIHPFNRGYDGALETGIRTALELGCTFAVTMDADGQHDPTLLDRFGSELEAGADLVIGIRDRMQRWAETVFGSVAGRLWGIQDPLCGMKGYRLQLFSKADQLNTYTSIGTELAVRAAKTGLKIHQIPVKTRPRDGDSRFGSGFKANAKIFKAMLIGLFFTR